MPSYIFSKKHEGMFLVELIIEYFLQLFQFKTGVTRELHVLKHSSSRKLLLHVGVVAASRSRSVGCPAPLLVRIL